jgi:hypothetical protein
MSRKTANTVIVTKEAVATNVGKGTGGSAIVKNTVSEFPVLPFVSVTKTVTLCSPYDKSLNVVFPLIVMLSCPSKE